jgi:hypothetical protein
VSPETAATIIEAGIMVLFGTVAAYLLYDWIMR